MINAFVFGILFLFIKLINLDKTHIVCALGTPLESCTIWFSKKGFKPYMLLLNYYFFLTFHIYLIFENQ